MSQHDLPLWARGAGALLLPFVGWWLLHTPMVRDATGDSVALLALTLVVGFLLIGLRAPFGLRTVGPWRDQFSMAIVVAVAVVFSLLIVTFDPFASDAVRDRIDPGVYLLTAAGVVAWGFAWSFVQQERFLGWFGIAAGAATIPLVVGGVGVVMQGGGAPSVCLVSSTTTAPCEASALQVFGFLAAVHTAVALVTFELAFRRLLLGHPDRAGLVLVVVAAAIAAGWSAVLGASGIALAPEWWLVGIAGVSAGSLYVLSGSLLVPSLFTGLAFAGRDALFAARAAAAAGPLERLPLVFLLAHLVVALGLAVLVLRRKGLLQGLG